ncbi:ABC transporter ATP-binding protein [Microvirga roseola]|uniref:ABC transporter ATP-binding protein n=1 Tax=Microvirga roseola TaxID=2883126 RepID=UPI001E3203BF|nr:ABC transporter ATP-binding protein [Microvirga roseola]
MASVSLRGIEKLFGSTRVLNGVSLDIADGEFVSLVGPSGCGKTTLLRILAGLEAQDAGDVFIGGRPVDDLPPKGRDIAMVFQSYALYPYMTVAENMALPLVMRRTSFAQRLPVIGRMMPGTGRTIRGISDEVSAVAESLAIDHLLARKPGQLSGGQRQRVALGRAMVRRPAVFLMDEPLSNLDAKLRVQARTEIAQLHRRLGATFVYVTHDQAEALTMSDRVAVMMDGELLQVAPPQDVYADPQHVKVAEFIGTPQINLVPGRVRADGGVEVLGMALGIGVSLPEGSTVSVGFRAEAVGMTAEGGGHCSALVQHIEHLGSEMLFHLGANGLERTVIARIHPARSPGARPGDSIGIELHGQRAFVFGKDGRRIPALPSATTHAPRLFEPGAMLRTASA